ncbi:MAG: peptidylprolyl isomerase [Candidatus Poribacteria bacterium]|nr:peptidylprolyl isomerase [Candidatus Poribacteria bacterium]MDE0506526.1 peptidylprolyl isomerase [Candidatus Poribacteria bacterium]
MSNLNSKHTSGAIYLSVICMIVILTTVFLASCTQERKEAPKPRARKARVQSAPREKPPEVDIQNVTAVIKTDKGDIEIAFYADDAPETAKNFAKNVRLKFYDGESFHRVEAGQLVQAGSARLNETIPLETSNQQYKKGAVAMAGDGVESHASEFYICLDTLETDEPHTIFGRVINGIDVLTKIEPNDKILSATLRSNE